MRKKFVDKHIIKRFPIETDRATTKSYADVLFDRSKKAREGHKKHLSSGLTSDPHTI